MDGDNIREREYALSTDRDNDRREVYDNLSTRGADHNQGPCIRENDSFGRTIDVQLHVPQTNTSFINIPAQNNVLNYPRNILDGESEDDYLKYLHEFYYGRFIGSETPITIENDSVVHNNISGTETDDDDNYMFEITNPNGLISQNSNTLQSSSEINNDTILIEDSSNQSNIIPGNENGEYIPGTNILKPRNRYPYETDNEYIDYLAGYYEQFFPQNNNTQQNNDSREIDTIYSDESTNLLYVEDEIATRFNLSSASFPGEIEVGCVIE